MLLAIDRNSSIAVRVERTRARANVRGLGQPGLARLDHAVRSEDVIEGDLLVTSGTDAVFPAGLPVGRVTRLQRAAHGLFLEGSVIPNVDPDARRGGAGDHLGRPGSRAAAGGAGAGEGPVRPLLNAALALLLVALQAALLRHLGGGAFTLGLPVVLLVHLAITAELVEGTVAAAAVGYVLDVASGGDQGAAHLAGGLHLHRRPASSGLAVDVRGWAGFAALCGLAVLGLSVGAVALTRSVAPPELRPALVAAAAHRAGGPAHRGWCRRCCASGCAGSTRLLGEAGVGPGPLSAP